MSFRVGATVLLGCDKNAMQSYGFSDRRVLGNLENVMGFLDKYEVDEIHAIVPFKGKFRFDPSEIFMHLSDVSVSTPLAIGGGITKENIEVISQNPFFERFIFNSAVFNDIQLVQKAAAIMGHQSIVALMPFVIRENILLFYNSESDDFVETNDTLYKTLDKNFNEILLVDASAEGSKSGFNFDVFNYITLPVDRILISGGITREDVQMAKKMGLAGVSVDNSVLHSEYSIKYLR